ncbi:multiheme c-type cytochrome [Sulfuriroseicoccus oceanibius]|uniref:Cytochrome c-552/4 domain-containing protein n=1 Tax=Sulfuriroseicoccus oceanibius TaxID=2707525 RepID=A0A6B3L005_9BACT|nr:multiheme c-type cytochrome [Sulfuriroseicoccus oceanibius]QQL46327.1 hypothetical protein G3M56_007070 [Sulfuriroseicoccus oceanibius]
MANASIFRWMAAGACGALFGIGFAWTPLPVSEDDLVFMPGTQPADGVSIEGVGQCMNCHSGYDLLVEPGTTWQGSMMAQAGRDPLWMASVVVALQDSIWLLGNANAGDLCVRCHAPVGWLGGRSDPPNLTALEPSQGDLEGVNCSTCHQMVDPVVARRQLPLVPEETDPVAIAAADTTYARDVTVISASKLFDGSGFIDASTEMPVHYGSGDLPGYIEATSGQFFMEPDPNIKRGNRPDAEPKSHSVYYSRFHKGPYQCATCHDVSNPALANVVIGAGTSESQSAATYFHLERTFSEFLLSAYAAPGGAPTNAPFAEIGVGSAGTCQDCHMSTAVGRACNKNNVPIRNDLRVHDLTGGNVWVGRILASLDQSADNPDRDAFNYALLSGSRYPGAVIDVGGLQGVGAALAQAADRAEQNLGRAATMMPVADSVATAGLRIYNNTGHKLISGFPEGRRMWVNVRFYDAANEVIGELNAYEPLVVSRDAEGVPSYVSGGVLQRDRDDLVFEAKMQSDLTGETASFHMVLATDRYKDNRIPPKGFNSDAASARLAQPRKGGEDALDYFSEVEYAGGYHDVYFDKPAGTVTWDARLYYQTTSLEYVRFLRDEINGTASTLVSPSPSGEPAAYIVASDPFFTTLKDWGNAIWELWLHNQGSPPVEMTTTISPPGIRHMIHEIDGFHVGVQTAVGRGYALEANDGLASGGWTLIDGPVAGDGALVDLIDPDASEHERRFYRVVNFVGE